METGYQRACDDVLGMLRQFKSGTMLRGSSAKERAEVETIRKTLNVVIAEVDAMRRIDMAGSLQR